MRQQQHELGRFPGVRDGKHGVGACDHPEVAVTGLRRMQEEGRGTGAGKRGGDLARDVAGLSHAGDDDPSLAAQTDAAGLCEAPIQARQQRFDRLGFDGQRAARGSEQQLLIRGNGRGGLHGLPSSAAQVKAISMRGIIGSPFGQCASAAASATGGTPQGARPREAM